VKNHRARAAYLLPSIVNVALLSTPGTARAMGGEGVAEGILILAFWFVVLLIASAVSFIPTKNSRSMGRYALLMAIRLSFPVWIASTIVYGKYIEPHFSRLNAEQNEVLKYKARQAFVNLCEKHAPQATQILQVVENESPKRVFIDQPDELFGLEVSLNLANCVTGKASPACSRVKLESIEWARLHSRGFAPCKSGVVPGTDRCLPEYKRYDLGDRQFSLVDIDQPTSDYVVRVDRAVETGERLDKIRKYLITLETRETRRPLAKTEILANWVGPAPCPKPADEVAQMLLRVFPQQ
jgi:hypothetical protein